MHHPQDIKTAAGLIYAKTADGIDLPVIDLSNPRFAVADDPQSYEMQRNAIIKWEQRNQRLPKFLMQLVLRRAARRSRLLQALFQSDQDFLDSVSTYILKLGPDNLPDGFDSPTDKRIASSPHVLLIRLRMQQIAGLLANALVPSLSSSPGTPLHLLNIAGGPALDSINTLVFLQQAGANLVDRPITIHVLDAHDSGPRFGANALAAMRRHNGPLEGRDIEIRYHPYDWNEPKPLAELVCGLGAHGAIIAASSEGGLFEYGASDAIISNLRALNAGPSRAMFVAGSVTSDSDFRKRMIAETRFKLYPRGIAGFEPLANSAGYEILRSESNMLSEQILLKSSI